MVVFFFLFACLAYLCGDLGLSPPSGHPAQHSAHPTPTLTATSTPTQYALRLLHHSCSCSSSNSSSCSCGCLCLQAQFRAFLHTDTHTHTHIKHAVYVRIGHTAWLEEGSGVGSRGREGRDRREGDGDGGGDDRREAKLRPFSLHAIDLLQALCACAFVCVCAFGGNCVRQLVQNVVGNVHIYACVCLCEC